MASIFHSPSVKKIFKKIIYSYYSWLIQKRKSYEYLFILSHMRSGSTVLTHLLVSNRDILGYGECHVDYNKGAESLNELICKVLFYARRAFSIGDERIVIDKILHNEYLLIDEVDFIVRNNIKVIFLLRDPVSSVNSIVTKVRYSGNVTTEDSFNYYYERLNYLRNAAKNLAKYKHKFVFLTYEQLLGSTDKVFRLIEEYLSLDSSLTEEYEILPTTGKPIIGDFSEKIKTGSLVREKESNAVVLSKEEVSEVSAAHKHTVETLEKYCIHIDQ